MPRSKKQFEEMRSATRDKIQSAAMHLFVHQGYGSTNVQQIADLAGISIGLLYRHYKNKEVLFIELVDFAMAGLQAVVDSFRTGDSPKKQLEQFVKEIYTDLSTSDDLANLMVLMTQSFFSGGASQKHHEIVALNQQMLVATADLIKRGQETNEFKQGPPHEMAMHFFSTIQGLAIMKITLKERFIMPSVQLIIAGLSKEGEKKHEHSPAIRSS